MPLAIGSSVKKKQCSPIRFLDMVVNVVFVAPTFSKLSLSMMTNLSASVAAISILYPISRYLTACSNVALFFFHDTPSKRVFAIGVQGEIERVIFWMVFGQTFMKSFKLLNIGIHVFSVERLQIFRMLQHRKQSNDPS
jgi:hypothetical protein